MLPLELRNFICQRENETAVFTTINPLPDFLGCLLVESFAPGKIFQSGVTGIYELKSIVCDVYYLTVLVYTETIIPSSPLPGIIVN